MMFKSVLKLASKEPISFSLLHNTFERFCDKKNDWKLYYHADWNIRGTSDKRIQE